MKILRKVYRPGPSAEKIIEESDRSRMETRLKTSPNVVDTDEAASGNYNFVMAVVLRQMRKGNMPRDAVVDALFKAGELFKTSYRIVMGKDAVLPPYAASPGLATLRPGSGRGELPASVPVASRARNIATRGVANPPAKRFRSGDYIWWEDGRGHANQVEYVKPSTNFPGMHIVQLGDGRRIRASLSHLSEENPY